MKPSSATSNETIADCDALIAGMEKCSDAWWGDIGTADYDDWKKLRDIAYRLRARASLSEIGRNECNRCGGLGYVQVTDGLGNGLRSACPCILSATATNCPRCGYPEVE